MSYPLITEAEAARLSMPALREILHQLTNALAHTEPGSQEAIQIAAGLKITMATIDHRNRFNRAYT